MNIQTSGQVTVTNLPPNAAQESGGNLATVASAQGASGTGITQPTGGSGILGWLSGCYSFLSQIYTKLTGSIAVTGTFWQTTQPVSGTGIFQVSTTSADNTTIDTETVTTTGYGTAYNTDGYTLLSFELSGNWSGVVTIEGSNAGTVYYPVLVRSATDDTVYDSIQSPGLYTINPNTQYLKYNFREINGSCSVLVLGKTTTGMPIPMAASQTVDPNSNVQVQMNVAGGIARDVSSAIVLSDAPAPIQIQLIAGTKYVFDTKGYPSFGITTQLLAGSVACSDDMATWSALSGAPKVLGALTATMAAATGYTFPSLGRFIQITATTSGSATIFLRNQPWQANYTTTVPTGTASNNIAQLNGTTVVNAGVAGTLAAGGNAAPGAAPTMYPMPTGSIDTTGFTRRVLSDTNGRLVIAALGSDGTYRAIAQLPPAFGNQNIPAEYVALADSTESGTIAEMLNQMLIELRMQSLYLYRLPENINYPLSATDDPVYYRNNPQDLI